MDITIPKVILGIIYILFLPGLAWSYVFFRRGEIDPVERLAISFGLSVAIVPLSVFWMNYIFRIKITGVSVTLLVLLLILSAILIHRIRNGGN